MQKTVKSLINFDCVEKLAPDPDSYPVGLFDNLDKAKEYLADFRWVSSIEEEYLGGFFPEIASVFLFKISPKLVGVDDFVWVIVGEVPSAYITVENSPNPACALDGYIGAVDEWAQAVSRSEKTDDLIPLNELETHENALILKRRLSYLRDEILPDCRGSLEEIRHR